MSAVTEDDLGKARLAEAARLYCNWGRWGEDDQAGTLNFITAEMVREAAASITRGQVFSLAIPFGQDGPQTGGLLRFNPMRFMLRDGDDTFSRPLVGLPRSIGGADDVIMLATHGATHWDALAHVHYDSKMWNGYDCREVSSFGAERNDIAQYKDRIVGRAVLLDFPGYFGVPWCEIGQAITGDDIDACAERQGVQIRTGDILLLRFGHIAMCRDCGSWGDYAGGNAPGLAFDTLAWIHAREIAGVASDTWGVEVRPNEFQLRQPAMAPDRDPAARPAGGGDLRPGGAGTGLRGRRPLRGVLLRQPAAGHQAASAARSTRSRSNDGGGRGAAGHLVHRPPPGSSFAPPTSGSPGLARSWWRPRLR